MKFAEIAAARQKAIDGDASALEPLIADDFSWILLNRSSSSGETHNKADTLDFLVNAGITIEDVTVLVETSDVIVVAESVSNPTHPDARYVGMSYYRLANGQIVEMRSVRGPANS